jgi:hypothetical protein
VPPKCGSGVFGMRVKCPWRSMAGARLATTGNAWTWRYRSISSDLHRPSRRILSVSTLAQSRAMAPDDRRERTEMSEEVMPN